MDPLPGSGGSTDGSSSTEFATAERYEFDII